MSDSDLLKNIDSILSSLKSDNSNLSDNDLLKNIEKHQELTEEMIENFIADEIKTYETFKKNRDKVKRCLESQFKKVEADKRVDYIRTLFAAGFAIEENSKKYWIDEKPYSLAKLYWNRSILNNELKGKLNISEELSNYIKIKLSLDLYEYIYRVIFRLLFLNSNCKPLIKPPRFRFFNNDKKLYLSFQRDNIHNTYTYFKEMFKEELQNKVFENNGKEETVIDFLKHVESFRKFLEESPKYSKIQKIRDRNAHMQEFNKDNIKKLNDFRIKSIYLATLIDLQVLSLCNEENIEDFREYLQAYFTEFKKAFN